MNHLRIPIETFNLYQDQHVTANPEKELKKKKKKPFESNYSFLSLFSTQVKSSPAGKKSSYHQEEKPIEASFSSVRHIIPLDGCGLACDFGNFIKVVHLDKPSLTEKERLKQTRDTSKSLVVDQTVIEEEEDSGCQCDEDDSACSPSTKGIDGCCGGANKEKNGGKCCGGNTNHVKKQQEEKRRQRLLLKQQQQQKTCGGIQSIADCSLKNNCPRAVDCASSNTAIASNTYSFNNWL